VAARKDRHQRRASDVAPEIATVADLLRWQASRGAPFDQAFAKPEAIRVALDRAHAKPGAPTAGAKEIAFFPPVTGG